MLRTGMSIWIYIVVLLIQSLTNADGVFYVSEGTTTADNASSTCKLATPDIHFGIESNTVSLDDTDLNIADGESVWSGYVQTYAAFLYEGCFVQNPSNSQFIHTYMYKDPAQCYFQCNTTVIGMQSTTCFCIPRPEKARTIASGCNIECSNPAGTVCGGNKAVSIYRKVQYPEPRDDGRDGAENQNCRALFWRSNFEHFYSWRECSKTYDVMCDIGSSSSEVEYYSEHADWSLSAERCLSNAKHPALELLTGFPALSVSSRFNNLIWIGQIRSHVIGKDVDSDGGEPGWRRGVITKSGGKFLLQFSTYQTRIKSLCEKVSTSTPGDLRNSTEQNATPDDDPQLPMIAVYIAVPAVFALVAVVVIVILCKIRKRKQDDPALGQEHELSGVDTRNAVTYEAYQGGDDIHDYSTIEAVNEYAVVKDADINVAIDTEYDTTTNPNQKLSQENDQSGLGTRNDASYESYHPGDDSHDYFTLEPVNENVDVNEEHINAALNVE